jgi:hypothetical protein
MINDINIIIENLTFKKIDNCFNTKNTQKTKTIKINQIGFFCKDK